ncbi:MAG: TetR/AcrR family transcriptional regulator [Gammaproteobacteria bacterium]|nr:TetR/AcrR family transcriptional regulator [Gammaproteobacteria bacterium]MBI5617068.1 TetR/AcrR family transcriptional regulator [Gammaproteobacteria bacterium]
MKEEIKEYKRERILEAAIALFHERGFAGTSVEAVADRLGVTKPFIYTYFENKHALLVAIFLQATERLLALVAAALAEEAPPDRQLANLVHAFARENMDVRLISRVFLQEEKHLDEKFLKRIRQAQKKFDTQLTELIARGVECGLFEVEDPAVAALAITGMIRWIQRWYREDGRREAEDLARIMSELALNLVRCKSTAAPARAVRTPTSRRTKAVTKEKAPPARRVRRKTNA